MTDTNPTQQTDFLTFLMRGDRYAIDVMRIREIRSLSKITQLPSSPSYMKGVMNLRGTVLPIVDLAERLGLPRQETNKRSVIVIVYIEEKLTGLIVDSVSDIVTLNDAEIQTSPPENLNRLENTIKAIAIKDEEMIRILNLEQTISNPQQVAA